MLKGQSNLQGINPILRPKWVQFMEVLLISNQIRVITLSFSSFKNPIFGLLWLGALKLYGGQVVEIVVMGKGAGLFVSSALSIYCFREFLIKISIIINGTLTADSP